MSVQYSADGSWPVRLLRLGRPIALRPARLMRLALLVIVAVACFVFLGIQAPVTGSGSVAAAPSGRTTVTTTSITIPTYVVEPALVEEFNPTYNMSYYRLDRNRYDQSRVEDRSYTLIVLENAYLKLSILPELGGRIYQAIFKPTGNNIFYQNPVIKPSPWGPPEMGWWLAVGGMEWGLPVEEHGYEWGTAWQYEVSYLPDTVTGTGTLAGTGTLTGTGGIRVTVWDTSADDRIRAVVSVTLLDDQALFHVTPRVENPTDQPIDYKFWLNAMLAPGPGDAPSEDMRFIMPGDEATVHSTGDPRLPNAWEGISWPVYNGVDWSRLGNWRQWFGWFQRSQAAGDFQAVYDVGHDEGVVRAYNSGLAQGVKFFGFGWGEDAIPPDVYTDDGSAYVEMHGGVAPTFVETRRLQPGQRITWNEQWYPVSGLGGLTWANSHVALHMESRLGQARVHVTTSSPRANVRTLLLRRSEDTILFDETVTQTLPGQPYQSPWIDTPGLSSSDLGVLVYSNQMLLGAYQFEGKLPGPTPPTPSPTPTATITPSPGWIGRELDPILISGWTSVVRVWVRGSYGLPVTIASQDGSWRTVNYVGSKPEYGPDALEFAPLAPGGYVITPQGLGVSVTIDLQSGQVAQVLFEPTGAGTPVPTPTPTPRPTAPPHGEWRVRIPTDTSIPVSATLELAQGWLAVVLFEQ